jgi:hypothetical protein
MGYHRHVREMEWFEIPLAIALTLICVTLFVVLIAGCFTVIWHVGHWVNWW